MDPESQPNPIARADVLEQALAILDSGTPWTAREIAAEIGLPGVDRRLVNSILSREGAAQVHYDPATHAYTRASDAPPLAASAADVPEAAVPQAPADAVPEPAAPRPAAASIPPPPRAAVLEAALRALADGRPRTTRQLAAELARGGLVGADKRLIGSVLTRDAPGRVTYDRTTFTYQAIAPSPPPAAPPVEGAPE